CTPWACWTRSARPPSLPPSEAEARQTTYRRKVAVFVRSILSSISVQPGPVTLDPDSDRTGETHASDGIPAAGGRRDAPAPGSWPGNRTTRQNLAHGLRRAQFAAPRTSCLALFYWLRRQLRFSAPATRRSAAWIGWVRGSFRPWSVGCLCFWVWSWSFAVSLFAPHRLTAGARSRWQSSWPLFWLFLLHLRDGASPSHFTSAQRSTWRSRFSCWWLQSRWRSFRGCGPRAWYCWACCWERSGPT